MAKSFFAKHLVKIILAFIVFVIMYHFFFNTYTTEHFYVLQRPSNYKDMTLEEKAAWTTKIAEMVAKKNNKSTKN
jgi:hypothetical protein